MPRLSGNNRRGAAALALLFVALVAANPATAASETVLYSFTDTKDGQPQDRLLVQNGSLFGATSYCCSQAYGTIFALTKGKLATLVTFNDNDGAYPLAGLIRDSSGALYGTTYYGGTTGNGTVFKLSKSNGAWALQTLWNFGQLPDGGGADGDLIMDSAGAFYGTTSFGGTYDGGSVFKLSYSQGAWTEQILYSVNGRPAAGLYMDKNGSLFGTTWGWGGNAGTVYQLIPANNRYLPRTLHIFGTGSDGQDPACVLVEDSNGALYGTTAGGGDSGKGTVFVMTRSNGNWSEDVIYSFAGGSNDGAEPHAGLYRSKDGTFYGTTAYGGANNVGTVFSLTQSNGVWTETVLHSFGGVGDGAEPWSALVPDKHGVLYGTTYAGGTTGAGTVYSLKP